MSLRRPILKCHGRSTGESQPGIPSFRGGHVHFPPTPEMSATYLVHSASTYDRSAIVVSPNVCSLPKRHCPHRTYVLADGKGEGRLLEFVQPNDTQNEVEGTDDTSCAEYHQDAVRMDYFSIPSSSSTPEMAWSESEGPAGLISLPSEINSNCGHSQTHLFDASAHDTHTRGASEAHEHVQAALLFLPHPPPPAVERKCNVSLRVLEDRPHSFPAGESGHPLLARSRWPRYESSSFTSDVPPDSGCLGGF